MDLFELVAKLILDTKEYQEGIKGAQEDAEKSGSKIGNTLGTAAKVGAAAVTAVTTATIAMGSAVVKSAGETAAYGDSIDKMSQKMGMSAEAYQEWDAIMQHSGTSIDAMQRGMTTLSAAAEKDSEAFEAIGLSLEEVSSMSQEDLFSATITALQNMEAGTERTVLAQKLLGGSAKELGALLNTSAEETEAMRQRVHELGGVMSDEAVKASAHYQDSLQDMQTAFKSLSRNLTSELLPGITTTMDGLAEIFTGDSEKGLGLISSGIDSLIDNLSKQLPQFVDIGVKILDSLMTAITNNLPKLAESAIKIITELTKSIIKNLPKMLDAGVEILFAIIDGLIKALPELIPAVVQVILTIVDKLTEPNTLMQLIDAAFQIIGAIAQGLINAIPDLIKAVPEIMLNLIEAILRFIPQIVASGVELMIEFGLGIAEGGLKVIQGVVEFLGELKDKFMERVEAAKEWGRDLIDNFTQGIKDKLGNLWNTVKSIASGIKNLLGFSEPKEGPLSDFHTYAPDMMALFAKGIKDNAYLITDQIGESFDFGGMINVPEKSAIQGGESTVNNYITVNGIEQLDELIRWYESRQVVARMA